MTQTAERQMELTLPMVPDVEIAAAKAAGNLGRQLGMDPQAIDEMAHAIVEACINAREHSCCADQRIYLRFRGTAQPDGRPRVEVWITDHGRGFDPARARSNRASVSGRPQKRGWGLQIMEAHMDEVEIDSTPHGTTIRMVKYGGEKS
ncbi:MAG TPA: ATP-binding protein [Thermoanaerobaculia bacterium]|nr:ATP-binding protein [Thermoanaerobaculia bacterium]